MVTSAVAIAVVAATAAVGAPASTERQASTIERKVSCATELAALRWEVFARNPAAGAAAATILTGDPNASTPSIVVGVDTRYKHYVLGGSCRGAAKRVPLTHRGLTSAGVVHAGDYQSSTIYCAATRHVLVHFKLSLDAAGKPVSATIALRTQPKAHNGKRPKSKPIGYAQWSPQRSVTYYSSACTRQ